MSKLPSALMVTPPQAITSSCGPVDGPFDGIGWQQNLFLDWYPLFPMIKPTELILKKVVVD